MTAIVVGSVRGGPGVTTAALLLAGWLDDSVVVEADLDGGVIAIRYRLGREPGLTTWAAAHATGPEDWRDHVQNAGGVPALVGPDAPDRMAMVWSRAGRRLGAALADSRAHVVVDAGRLRSAGVAADARAAAALTLFLVRPVPEDLVGLAHRLPAERGPVGLVLVGSGAYSSAGISAELGVEVVGTVPDDDRSRALVVSGGFSSRSLARTPLARAMRGVADAIAARVAPQVAASNGSRPAEHGTRSAAS